MRNSKYYYGHGLHAGVNLPHVFVKSLIRKYKSTIGLKILYKNLYKIFKLHLYQKAIILKQNMIYILKICAKVLKNNPKKYKICKKIIFFVKNH